MRGKIHISGWSWRGVFIFVQTKRCLPLCAMPSAEGCNVQELCSLLAPFSPVSVGCPAWAHRDCRGYDSYSHTSFVEALVPEVDPIPKTHFRQSCDTGDWHCPFPSTKAHCPHYLLGNTRLLLSAAFLPTAPTDSNCGPGSINIWFEFKKSPWIHSPRGSKSDSHSIRTK